MFEIIRVKIYMKYVHGVLALIYPFSGKFLITEHHITELLDYPDVF